MPIIHAIILGLVQGISEFLPISSSGHLLLVPWLFKWHDFAGQPASFEKAFDVALHLGTLVAVVAYFWKDLVVYVRDGIRAVIHRDERATPHGRLAWLFVLGAVPAAVVGAVASNFIERKLGRPVIIAISLIVFGLLLGWADRLRGTKRLEDLDRNSALLIGTAQIIALNPGTSRSGITMTGGRLLGFSRDAAARISFLLAIPVTAGAIVFKLAKLVKDGIPSGFGGPLVVGVITAGISGWVAVWGTLKLIRTRSFAPFVVYRVLLGITVLVVAAVRG